MNIPELKKSKELINEKFSSYFLELCKIYPPSKIVEFKQALDKILSACQLLCDTSDKLPPKKEHVAILSDKDLIFTGKLTEGRTVKDWIKYGSNQRREEDILWISKMVMLGKIKLNGIDLPQ